MSNKYFVLFVTKLQKTVNYTTLFPNCVTLFGYSKSNFVGATKTRFIKKHKKETP
jgi:hypothetical protein